MFLPIRQPRYAFAILTCLLLGACAANKPSVDKQDITVNRIVVMPVTIAETAAGSQSLNTGKAVLNDLIRKFFQNDERVNILSEAQAESYHHGYDKERQHIKEIGKRLKADAVMTWQLSRYEEKDGGDYSVNHPSSVAFSYRLTNIASGRTLCGAKVDKTQDTLTGNLFSAKKFLHRGGKWIPVSQLTSEIVNQKLQECRFLTKTATH